MLDLAKLSSVKPHQPMIKFSQGRRARGSLQMPGISASSQAISETELEIKAQEIPAALEWWEKPPKYCREHIEETEIDQINSGGASRLFQ